MKKLLDINTWIALTLETHPHHEIARAWYRETQLARGDLVFGRATELGFLRLVTQAAVMKRCGAAPLSNGEALAFLASLCNDPTVSRADEPAATRKLWFELADAPQAAPNIFMDAYLVAFAIVLGAELVTFDRGFVAYEKRGLKLLLLKSP